MLYVKGIATMAKNAGSAFVGSFKSIFRIGSIMKSPTIIKAGAIADSGTSFASGTKKRVDKIARPVTTEENPVFPPDATPAADST